MEPVLFCRLDPAGFSHPVFLFCLPQRGVMPSCDFGFSELSVFARHIHGGKFVRPTSVLSSAAVLF